MRDRLAENHQPQYKGEIFEEKIVLSLQNVRDGAWFQINTIAYFCNHVTFFSLLKIRRMPFSDFMLSFFKEVISNAHNFTLSAPLNVAPPGVGKIPPILTMRGF